MEEPSFGLVVVVLVVLLIAGFAYDAYWASIEWFARKFVREPLDRRAQRSMRDDAGVTRRRGLIASAIASVVLLLAMAPADQRMQDTGGPGIIPFEVTGGQERADEILAEWGEKGQDAARQSLLIDYGYLIAYGVFFTLAAAATRDLARSRDWKRMARIGAVVVYLAALSAVFDAFENTCLLLTLEGSGEIFPFLATVFAACKFLLLAVTIAYLLTGLVMRLRDRGPDSMPAQG